MATTGSNPSNRRRFLVALSIAAVLVVVASAVQLAFQVPRQDALPIAWAAFGVAVLISVLLVWIQRIGWVVSILIVALGVELFSAALMLRRDMVALACVSAFVIFVVWAFVGSRKQAAMQQHWRNG